MMLGCDDELTKRPSITFVAITMSRYTSRSGAVGRKWWRGTARNAFSTSDVRIL